MSVLPEPFTRERADGKIPVKVELIRAQVRRELDGTPEGEAEVARWQAIETDYNQCRLSSARATKSEAEEVFSVCMSERGYVYMLPIDAEQFHNDIAFELQKERDERLAAERKAEEERIAAEKKAAEKAEIARKKTEAERLAAEKKAADEAAITERQNELDHALREAVYEGNAEEEARLIAEGADPKVAQNARNWQLLQSIWATDIEAVRKWLADGAKPTDYSRYGKSDLISAIVVHELDSTKAEKAKIAEIVKLLLDADANPNVADDIYGTPLYQAMFYENTEIVKLLLAAGANPDVADDKGMSALITAIDKEDAEVVKALLSAGADSNTIDNGGVAQFYVFLSCNWIDWVANEYHGISALMFAVLRGDAKIVKMLLDADANPFTHCNGMPALVYAVRSDDAEIVKLLLSADANPNAEFNSNSKNTLAIQLGGTNALIFAAVFGHAEIAKILLSAGANPNVSADDGSAALDMAATGGHAEIVKILLSAGANPNWAGVDGWAALHQAARGGHAEVAEILLDCGASPDQKTDDGWNTRGIAQQRPLIVPVLEKYDAKIRNGWHPKSCKNRQVAAAAKPKAPNAAEGIFANVWRSVVVINAGDNQGSGVIVRPNVVATNCHVVDGGGNLVVSELSATIRKRDDKRDLCLLNVAGLQGDIAKVRRYETLNVGENVYGLGAPQGLDLSLSSGIISQLRQGGGERFIQTDAAISPGSSGGGLFDSDGNLIGIMTFKIADENVEGIGFAIPADLVLGN